MNGGALAIGRPPGPAQQATGAVTRLGDLGAAFATANVTPDRLHTVASPAGFVLQAAAAAGAPAAPVTGPGTAGGAAVHTGTGPPAGTGVQQGGAKEAFIHAATTLMDQLARPPGAGLVLVPADLNEADAAVRSTLDPVATIEAPLAARLTGISAGPRRTDPLEPVMAAPDFPQPMYQPLISLSQQWLLPGLDRMAEGVALFTTNWQFVESFMIGLNHEMARKLLWNGYPTDQRGSCFRHFWDIRSRLDGSTDADFGPAHLWTAPLGSNRLISADPLVLLVRGELIRRYPNLVVSAAPAVPGPDGRQPGPAEQHPIFYGRVDPDVALYGFDLTAAAARGDPGWFFLLAEHPSEPRFGLEPSRGAFGAQPDSWQALRWDHLAASAAELAALGYLNLDAPLPRDPVTGDPTGASWHASGPVPSRAADLAHITVRIPKRLAIHGSRLIPPPPLPPHPVPLPPAPVPAPPAPLPPVPPVAPGGPA